MRTAILGTGTVLALALLVQPSPGLAKAGCVGADPAIVSARVKSMSSDGKVNQYVLAATVRNLGRTKQASNVLQFTDVMENGIRLEDRGIPPLAPGQAYTVTYTYVRSVDAGSGTTQITFQLRFVLPKSPSAQNCNPNNDSGSVTF